jgi:uncharacterized repeat protein (TIGR03803 family)
MLTPPPNGKGAWAETILYSFSGSSDGAAPQAGVILDAAGNLFGTTRDGGSFGAGTVFQLVHGTNDQWSQSVLYTFMGNGADGGSPLGSLVFDAIGNLYGTASRGGPLNGGVAFQLSSTGDGVWTYLVIYAFDALFSPDGNLPAAGMVFDGAGNLYGTTKAGGQFGFGTVFELISDSGDWTETILHSFAGGGDGATPLASLVFDNLGNLYGTTSAGGGIPVGAGTVFRLSPREGNWTEAVFRFASKNEAGAVPTAPVILDDSGGVYGTASLEPGVVFRIRP